MFKRWFKRKKDQDNNGRFRHGNEHLIELHQVVKDYETAAGTFTALKNVNLQVDDGEFVAVIGKSGSGKSTLINMITGIDRPTTGEVLVGDTAVHQLNEGQMAVWRGRNLGIVFQFFQLLPTLTVVENVMLPMDFCDLYSAREREERAMHLLDQVEMVEHAHKLPTAISGGQQQRVAIARALANDPPIIVADEPTGNLDSVTAESVFRLFAELVEGGKTILMVTHDHDLAKRVTRTIILSDGELIEEYLSHTFPALTEEQLVHVTRNLQRHRYDPAEVILHRGEQPDKFYLVTKGRVEVVLHPAKGPDFVVARMERGQYFGEIEMLAGGENMATVRAADIGTELVTIDHDTFDRLVKESEAVRSELGQKVQERLLEHVNSLEEQENDA